LIFYFYYIHTHTYSNIAFSLYKSFDSAVDYFNSIVARDNLTLTMDNLDGPSTLLHTLIIGTYVSGMQISPKYSKDINHIRTPTISLSSRKLTSLSKLLVKGLVSTLSSIPSFYKLSLICN
jgi:hypothetical protein